MSFHRPHENKDALFRSIEEWKPKTYKGHFWILRLVEEKLMPLDIAKQLSAEECDALKDCSIYFLMKSNRISLKVALAISKQLKKPDKYNDKEAFKTPVNFKYYFESKIVGESKNIIGNKTPKERAFILAMTYQLVLRDILTVQQALRLTVEQASILNINEIFSLLVSKFLSLEKALVLSTTQAGILTALCDYITLGLIKIDDALGFKMEDMGSILAEVKKISQDLRVKKCY